MRTLDRYVIREVLAPFALALLVLTFILIIPFIIAQAETMIAKGVPWTIVARVMVTLLPASLGLTIPMSLLVGLLIALGRLSGDREVAAMLACGISPLRLLRPALGVGFLAWASTTYVMIWAIPDANQTFREITTRLVADRAEGEVKPRVFFEDFPGFVVYVRDVPMTGGWTGVLAADTRDPAHPVLYLAEQGRMLVDRSQRTIQMVLTQGTRHSTSAREPDGYEVVTFAETIVPLDPESVFPRSGPARGEREMTIAELQTRAAEFEADGRSSHSPRIEIHKKFSIPAACLVFALLGVALGATYQRDGKFVGIARGLAVIFLYYALMWLGQALAQGGHLPPWLAMWLPNLVLGFGGVGLMWRHLRPNRTRWSGPRPRVAWFRRDRPVRAGSWTSRVADLGWLRPSLLDTYVGLLYFRTLGLCLTGMAGLFYISTFIDLSDNLFKGTATTGMLLQYFWFATPQYLYYIIALAVLLAAIVTIGTLTKSSELIVMRACGISLYRTAVPLFVAAALASAALFAIEDSVLAPANRRANELVRQIRGQAPRTYDALNRAWLTGGDGTVYHYQAYSPSVRELSGLTVLTFAEAESSSVARRTFARVATAGPDADTSRSWLARSGWTRTFADDLTVSEFTRFDEQALTLETPDTFVTEAPPPAQMNYAQLRAYIGDLRASGYDVRADEVALYRKVAFPFVTIVMTLIGVPFAVLTGRRGALYGVGVGIVLALVYWTMISVTAAFGAGGAMAPMLAAWTPNLAFGAGAVYLLLTVRT
jgi:LPS export ABC transporter permease LptF/LPS export ABC transporter permease LptG